MNWLSKLIADKDGNPSEHIIAALWGSFALLVLAAYLCYTGHAPALAEYGIAHGTVWGAAAGSQRLSGG